MVQAQSGGKCRDIGRLPSYSIRSGNRPLLRSRLGNRSERPIVAGKRGNLYALNDAQLQAWIEMAHRPFIEINDATGRQRPHIIYLDDDLLAFGLDEGKFRLRAKLDPAKFAT